MRQIDPGSPKHLLPTSSRLPVFHIFRDNDSLGKHTQSHVRSSRLLIVCILMIKVTIIYAETDFKLKLVLCFHNKQISKPLKPADPVNQISASLLEP